MRVFASSHSIFILAFAVLTSFASAQSDLSTLISAPKGTPEIPVRFGYVNVNTGNLHLEIPLQSMPQRGQPSGTLMLRYDSAFWIAGELNHPPNSFPSFWNLVQLSGLPTSGLAYPTNVESQGCGNAFYGNIDEYYSWEYIDPSNTMHTFFPGITNTQNCYSATGVPEYPNGYGNATASGLASDGSGYFISITNGSSPQIFAPQGPAGVNGNGGNQTGYSWGDYGCFAPSTSVQNQPYTVKPSVTCTTSIPARNGVGGATAGYSETWEYVPVCTQYYSSSGSALVGYCGGIWALESITMPDGVSTYAFTYDTGTSPGHYGQMTQMTLPTGGTVSYRYYPPSGADGDLDANIRGDIETITDNGGTTMFTRTFHPTTGYYATPFVSETVTYPPHITNPLQPGVSVSDNTVFTTAEAQPVGNVTPTTITQQDYLNGVLTKTASWDTTVIGKPSFTQTTWNQTGATDRIQYTYTTGDVVTLAAESLNGSLYRSISTTFQQDTSTVPYVSQYHMFRYPTLTQVTDGTGNIIAQESRTYDEYSASYCNTGPPGIGGVAMLTGINGALGHDDVNFGTSQWARGNATTITSGVGSTVTTHNCYDTLGNVTETVDANGKPTRYSYVDNYSDSNCPYSSPTYAFPTLTTNALGYQTKQSYNSCLGAVTQAQDANDIAASRPGTMQSYDLEGRPSCTTTADGGSSCTTYPYVNTVTQKHLLGGGGYHVVTTTLNTFGSAASVADSSSGDEVDKTYDGLGRLSTVTNPYNILLQSGSSTPVPVTSYAYDGFGRQLAQLQADGTSELSWSYTGTNVDTYDEGLVHHQLQYDPAGRLSTVMELGTSASPINYETDYTYDVLNNLKQIDQWGGANGTAGERQRKFGYDSLSRITSSTNPETGTINYYYTKTGGALCAGDVSLPCSTTDARGITITYSYDGMSRVTSKQAAGINYSYTYDHDSVVTATNAIGRLVWQTNNINAERHYSYDAVGRIATEQGRSPSNSGSTSNKVTAIYDVAGNLSQLTYPDGRVITHGYDAAGRLSAVTYASFNGTSVNTSYINAVAYAPGNQPGTVYFDKTGNPTLTETDLYDARQRLSSLAFGQTTSTWNPPTLTYSTNNLWAKQYTWSPSGNLLLATDNVKGIARQYNYDSLNRLKSAQDIAGTVSSSGETTNTSDQTQDNTLANSQQIGAPGWGSQNISFSPNAVAAPDGSMTATIITGVTGASGPTQNDSWVSDYVFNPSLYDGAAMSGSVWLRVPSGTLSTNLYLINNGDLGSTPIKFPVNVTTAWQQFKVSGTNQNGLTALALQIGGANSFSPGQIVDVWGLELQPVSSPDTNILQSSQQVGATGWQIAEGNVTVIGVAAPDGTNTASTVTSAGSATLVSDLVANPVQYNGKVVTGSIYLCLPNGAAARSVNLYLNDTISSGNSAVLASTTVALSTTWQRFSVTATAQSSLTQLWLQVGGGTPGFTSGQAINMWGAQMDLGSSPGTYIATTDTTTSTTGGTEYLAANGLNEAYAYDAFGNLQQSGNFSFEQAFTNANQLSGWQYDQAGNLLSDQISNSYTYDANGMLSSDNNGATTYAYYYDAAGNRAGKSGATPTDTIYFGGQPIARYSGGGWTDLIYGIRGIVAEVQGTVSSLPTYRIMDHLGSGAGTFNGSGVLQSQQDFAPFGQVFIGSTQDPYKFTGKERDTESGLDYFGARYYSSNMGRFTSPDPSQLLYADLSNPQSLNLYSYVRNNPLRAIDPSGLDCVYLNDDGTGLDDTTGGDGQAHPIDHNSNQADCNGTGGYWAPGTVDGASSVQTSSSSDLISVSSTTNGQNVTSLANCSGCSTTNPDGSLLGAFTETFGNQSISDMSTLFADNVNNPVVDRSAVKGINLAGHFAQFPGAKVILTEKDIVMYCRAAAFLQGGSTVPGNNNYGTAPNIPSDEGGAGFIPEPGASASSKVSAYAAIAQTLSTYAACKDAVTSANR